MNDPWLDEPAQEAAHDVENRMHAEDEQAEREQREYLDPSYVSQPCFSRGQFGLTDSLVDGGLHLQQVH